MTSYKQTSIFGTENINKAFFKPVNVASVPKLSPFRYPGGKTWFVPTLREWFANFNIKPQIIVEPFAGGGIISLTSLCENMVDKATMVELDSEIAAVWKSVVSGDSLWLANRILTFNLTKKALIDELSKQSRLHREIAFKTILKNRTFHGGILAEGSGFLKHGENGKGILSRWYPKTLAKRFQILHQISSKIDFRHDDAFNVLEEFATNSNAVFFIDPPYTAGGKKAGKRLYKHYHIDHDRLFSICASLKGDFIMTYDDAEEVKELAKKYHFQTRQITMNNTHHALMKELVIGKNLSWLPLPEH